MSIVIQLPRDINKLCRTCMKVAEENEDSFENRVIVDNQVTELSKMLESVTSLKIGVNDGLPETLCSQCIEYLNISYLFKNNCSNVDKDLRELILLSDDKTSFGDVQNTETNETKCTYVCHNCLKAFKSNYELSMHLIEHNKHKTLSEQFTDNRMETKPIIGIPEKTICDQIIERKMYTLMGLYDRSDSSVTNDVHDKTSEAESPECKSDINADNAVEVECDFCGAWFASESQLNSHACELPDVNKYEISEDVNTTRVFDCSVCFKSLPNMVTLSLHFLKHGFTLDLTTEPSFCESCGQLFDTPVLLAEHYEADICKKDIWICSLCNMQFETETQLLAHDTIHPHTPTNFITPSKYSCILCDELFITKDTLLVHILSHIMKRYSCKECSISFCTQQSYFQHLKLHPGYQFTCVMCGQLAKTKHALKTHVIGVHSDGPVYTCKVCNKNFKTKGRLKTHSHIHEERKNYMCSYCGYTTHKSGDLQIHIRSHTSERPYKCTFAGCEMKFKTSSHLCNHLKRHLNIRNFKCPTCNVSFGTRHSLKVHHMLHTGEKPHSCLVCGQDFRRKYHLKVHMKLHDNNINLE